MKEVTDNNYGKQFVSKLFLISYILLFLSIIFFGICKYIFSQSFVAFERFSGTYQKNKNYRIYQKLEQ